MSLMVDRDSKRRPGRPYIGPKVQVNVHCQDHDWIVDEFKRLGLSEEDWPNLLREVFATGVAFMRSQRRAGLR